MRVPRRGVWWPLGVAAVALGSGAAAGWFVAGDDAVAPRPSPAASLAPTTSADGAGPLADARTPEERVTALRRVTEVGPLLDVLSRPVVAAGDAQLRAMALTALGRHPADARARGAVLAALAVDRPREERLLALTVVGGMIDATDPSWARAALEVAVADPDVQVRDLARAVLPGAGRGDDATR